MWSIHQFKDISPSEAKASLAGLDKVGIVPLYEKVPLDTGLDAAVVSHDDDGYPRVSSVKNTPKVWGIKNLTTGTVNFGAAKNYTPLGHETALTPVLDAVDRIGLKTLVSLENHHDVSELFILFPDLVANDHQEGIQLGVRFKNVYNDKKSFKGTAFGWRLACANGALYSTTFGDLVISAWHTPAHVKAIPDKVEVFIEGILQRSHILENTIDNAIKAELAFKDYAEVANTLNPVTESKKIAEVVASIVKDPAHTNKWELYNAITEFASHEAITHTTRERLVSDAEKALLGSKPFAPIPVPAVA